VHDLIGWSSSDIGSLKRSAQVAGSRGIDIACNPPRPDVIDGPFHEITVAILRIAVGAFVVPDVRFPKDVPLIRWTMKNLGRTLVTI